MAQAATAQAITNQSPPVTGTESLQDVLGRLGRESSNMRSAEAAGATQFASKIAGATQKLAAAEKESEELKAPKIEPMPEAPKPVYTDPMQAFGSPAMVLAVLGGMLTQNSLATALNAGAGVMKAQRENDLQAQKYNMDVWKQAVQNATNSNNFELDKYRAAIEKLGTDRSSAIAELNAWSHALVNPQFAAVVASGDDKAILGYFSQMERTRATLNLELRRVIASNFTQPQMVYLKDGTSVVAQQDRGDILGGGAGKWYTADSERKPVGAPDNPIVGIISSTSAGNPEASTGMAKLIADYAAPPLSGWALRTPSGQQIMADVKQINPNYNANMYPTIGKTMQAFSSGPQGTRIAAINVAIQHLGVLNDLAHALHSGDTQAVNAASQAFAAQFGSAAPTNFNAVQQIVGQEVVKAVVTAGGGVTERQDAAEKFARRMSPEQMDGAIESVERLLAGQIAGLKQQYESVTSVAPGVVPFDNFLLPRTKKVLDSLPKSTASGETPKYHVGQVLTEKGKKYKVTGGDLNNDPDIELVP